MTISVVRIDTSTSNYLLTVSISSSLLLLNSEKPVLVKRSLSEYENLYLYLLFNFPFYLLLPPPFLSSLDFIRAKTVLFLENVFLNYKELSGDEKVLEFFTGNFSFQSLVPQSSDYFSWNLFTENVLEIDVFYTEISAKIAHFLDKIQEIGSLTSLQNHSSQNLENVLLLLDKNDSFSKILKFLKLLERKDSSREKYLKTSLNDELIYIKRWLNSLNLSLKKRESLLRKYSKSCANTQKNVKKLEKIQASQKLSTEKVNLALEEFEKIKVEEQCVRIEFKKVNEELKPLLISHVNEIEMDLIGIWGRWADFQRGVETEFLNVLKALV